MKKPAYSAGAAAIAVLLAGMVGGAAAADQPTSSVPDATGESFLVEGHAAMPEPSADLLTDIERSGGGTPAPDDPLLWQQEFAQAVSRLQLQYPHDYSGSAIEEDGVWVSFSGPTPAGAIDVLRQLPGQVEVRPGAGWSETEIREMGEGLHFSVLERADVVDVATSIDTNRGTIHVLAEVTPESSLIATESAIEQSAAGSMAKRGSNLGPVEVSVSATTSPVSVNDSINGGSQMIVGVDRCTAGFSVRSASYANGMLTADHCANGLQISGTTLAFRAGSTSRDVQWHSSSATTNAQFHVGASTLRAITSSNNPVSGTTVCKYGRTTGGSCDRVSLVNQCGGSYCGLFTTLQRQAAGGDSGGPWYYGNAGYGIHSRGLTISGAARDALTGLQNTAATLGVTVKLS